MRFLRYLISGLLVSLVLIAIYQASDGRMIAASSHQEEPSPSFPSPEVDTGHPRLFFTRDDISALENQAAGTHREIWEPIQVYVNSEEGTSPPETAPANGDLDTYRNYGNQIIPFAFVCVVSEQTLACDLARRYLLTYADWEQWSNDNERSLALAHMVFGNALAYDWLFNRLNPEERSLVEESLGEWAQKLYEASRGDKVQEWNNWWTDAYVQNHYFIIHSALGMAGLALMGEDARAQDWIDQAVEKLAIGRDFLNGIRDGSWHEGITYQGYMLTLSLPFWVNLREIAGIDLLPHTYLRSYPYWRIYNYLPGTTRFILAHGDFEWDHGQYRPQNVLRFSAREYGDGHAEWMAQQHIQAGGRFANTWATPWYVFEFLYYDPAVQPVSPADLPEIRVFPDLEGVIWRTGWDEGDLVFGLKTSAYGGRFAYDTFTQQEMPWNMPCEETNCKLSFGHNHDDANGFYLYREGQWLAPESEGVGKFETEFHNTVLIDRQGQFRPPRREQKDPESLSQMDGFLAATANTPGFDFVAANATQRYAHLDDLQDFTRYVLFVRPNYFLMLDNLSAGQDHRYEWVSHFSEDVSIQGAWVRGVAGGGQLLGVNVISPDPFTAVTGDDGKAYVRIRPDSETSSVRFINLLFPTEVGSWETRPAANLMEETGEAALIRVQMEGTGARTDDILLRYTQPGSLVELGRYKFDGQVAVVVHDGNGNLQQVFVHGGTRLRDMVLGANLVQYDAVNGPVEIIFEAETVWIYGDVSAGLTFYAPDAQHLKVNGTAWQFTRSGEYVTVSGPESIPLPQ